MWKLLLTFIKEDVVSFSTFIILSIANVRQGYRSMGPLDSCKNYAILCNLKFNMTKLPGLCPGPIAYASSTSLTAISLSKLASLPKKLLHRSVSHLRWLILLITGVYAFLKVAFQIPQF